MAHIVKVCSKCKTLNPPHMTYCAKCGATLPVLKIESDLAPVDPPAYAAAPEPESDYLPPPAATRPPDGPIACRITDIEMPFWSMVNFMVKAALAAIPALIILTIFAVAAMAVLGSFFGGILHL